MKAAHIAPFDVIIRNYIGSDEDLTGDEALWYFASILNFDTVPAVMFPYLAEMFGVEGFKGMDYATTDALKRQTLKNALLMKRRHGTAWALKTALENAGFLFVKIIEDVPTVMYWDGSYLFDGSVNFDSSHWAHFKIEMEPPVGVLASAVDLVAVMKLVNYWKRKCTLCVGIQINQLVITSFGIGNSTLLWDGSATFDGSETFDGT